MYTDFYNLKEKPFNLTPSPRFLYLGEVHKEALALLTYGVVERKGFILLTGEVGTGKTTMVQAFLNSLDDNVMSVCISNPLLSPKDFLKYLAFSAFKKNVRFKTKGEVLLEFEAFLKQRLEDNQNFVLVIDEAQDLSFEVLEEIRLLSNMETGEEKLLNIFLVGQPELNEKLSEPRSRALLQRISIRYHIKPLDLKGTEEYIATRLKLAGAKDGGAVIFPKGAIKAIHQFSEGYPRLINILADNAMLLGYSKGKRKIAPAIIEECYQDIKVDDDIPSIRQTDAGSPDGDKSKVRRSRPFWKWAAAIIMVVILGFLIKISMDFIGPQLLSINNDIRSLKDDIKAYRNEIADDKRQVANIKKKEGKVSDEWPPVPKGTPSISSKATRESSMNQEWKTITVKEGDKLSDLARAVYGKMDQSILDLLINNNPNIKDIHRIRVGQKILFPPLMMSSE
ncbi:MAG: AAA family ATPase [Deltaproteobacteria bacterium]|nr:AAA family ATPase [Deltaproteobacteria bacterium]